MKISNEQLQALQAPEARRKPSGAMEGFEDLLAQQMITDTAQETTSAMDPQMLLRGALPVSPLGTAGAVPAALQGTAAEMAARMEGMFSGMDDYARQLASDDPAALRGAYSQLERTGADIASFRAAFPNMETEQPELAAMVNELDVLRTTEKFKFNRGDYL